MKLAFNQSSSNSDMVRKFSIDEPLAFMTVFLRMGFYYDMVESMAFRFDPWFSVNLAPFTVSLSLIDLRCPVIIIDLYLS